MCKQNYMIEASNWECIAQQRGAKIEQLSKALRALVQATENANLSTADFMLALIEAKIALKD